LSHPGLAECGQGTAFEGFLSHGEDEPFFFIEVRAGGDHGDMEEATGRFEVPALEGGFEVFVDFVVFVVEGFLLADLGEAVFERFDQEFIFNLGMCLQGGIEHAGQGVDFGEAFEFWQGGFDMIEEIMEHDMFGQQGICDLHDVTPIGRPAR
jgi:hypothetical protein